MLFLSAVRWVSRPCTQSLDQSLFGGDHRLCTDPRQVDNLQGTHTQILLVIVYGIYDLWGRDIIALDTERDDVLLRPLHPVSLSDRDAFIGHPLREIANKVGIGNERIDQVTKCATSIICWKMKTHAFNAIIKPFPS